jgi:hypothetical protein
MKKFLTTLLVVFICTARINAYVSEDQPTIEELQDDMCFEFFEALDAFVSMAMKSDNNVTKFFNSKDAESMLRYVKSLDTEDCFDGAE